MTDQQPSRSSVPSAGWGSWIAADLFVSVVAFEVVISVTGWTPIPVRRLYLNWAISGHCSWRRCLGTNAIAIDATRPPRRSRASS